MKQTRKLLCLALAVLMVFSVCGAMIVSAAESFLLDSDGSGVAYYEGTYESCNIHTLTFDTDDYAVIPFSGYSGGTYTLNGQYSQAVKWGYDVVGIINGDFFNMSNGYLNDYIVSNGEVVIGDNGRHSSFGGMTCIMPDGSIKTVAASQLKFTTYFNGVEVPVGISYVNRRPNRNAADGWSDALYYFDSTSASDKCPLEGVAVIGKKLNGTVLAIGGTMDAQVVSVEDRSNANGITLAKDEFLLYVRASSPLAAKLRALTPGDSVTVTTSETVADAVDVTTNATSILANIGYLVKDGVNFAATDEFNKIDPHGNKYKAAWTAFGTKADGSWMFFISEASNQLTQPQVAEYMISQGCTTVIRLDGGGSVAMYLNDDGSGAPGYAYNQGRNVPDCLMVVKRSSAALQVSEDALATLEDLVEKAQNSTNEAAQAALEYAQSVLDNEKSISGDYIKAIMRLQDALNDKGTLGKMLAIAAGAIFSDYSEYVLTRLREAYSAASAVFGDPAATADEVAIVTAQLVKWINARGEYSTSDAFYSTVPSDRYFRPLKFNSSIQENDIIFFTPGASIEQSAANLKWAGAVLLRKNAHGSYVVEKTVNGAAMGTDTYVPEQLGFTVVPDDCLVIGAHGSVNNNAVRAAAVVGSVFISRGIDIEEQSIGVGAYFGFETSGGEHTFDWKVIKTPTCSKKGSEILTCVYCDETIGAARTIDELDHVYKDGKCLLCGNVQATNVALGKDYTIGYGTNNATYNTSLTDGNASTGLSYQPDEWFAFTSSNTQNNVGTATIDLGDDYVIDYASVHTYFGKTGDGIVTPARMKVEVSSDGINYTALGEEVTYANPEQGPGFTTEWVNFVGEKSVTGRYVKLTVVIQGAFAFINEIEVYGVSVKDAGPTGPTVTVVVKEEIDVDGKLDDTGYDVADWVNKGFWQGAEVPEEKISGKYTVRTDAENIYIALEIDGTIAPHTLETYNPAAAFAQNTATDLRIWFKKDVETRTFFDIQFNGTEFTLANWNTTHNAVKDNVEFVVNYADGKLVAEISVPMADLGITDSFYLLVSYCETFATGYNAIHYTKAAALSSDYWAVTNTSSYTEYTVSDIKLGEYEKEIPCEHEHVTTTTVEATCTESGYTENVCEDCGTTVSHTEIPALGHDYKDGVCTRCGEKDPDYTAPTTPKKGDLDGDGVITAIEYMLIKRAALGTFNLSDEQKAIADFDGDGEITSIDYMFIKRAAMGTFVISD